MQGVGVEADAGGDALGDGAAVAEGEADRVVGLAGVDPDGAFELAAGEGDGDDVAVADASAGGEGGGEGDGVFPDELGERLGEFLEPGVVGDGAVPDGGVGADEEVEGIGRGGGRGRRGGRVEGDGFGGEGGAVNEAGAEGGFPARGEGGGVGAALPEGAEEVAAGVLLAVGEVGDQFVGGAAFVERLDGGLHEADGAVDRAGVAPSFERVLEGQVPLAADGGFVDLGAGVDGERDLGEGVGEGEAAGCAVGGVGVDHEQDLDIAGVHVVDEGGQVLGLGEGGLGVEDGVAGVAEGVVEAVDGFLDFGRLGAAGDDEAPAAGGVEGGGGTGAPGVERGGAQCGAGGGWRGGGAAGEVGEEACGEGGDFGGGGGDLVVGLGAGEAGERADGVHFEQAAVFDGGAAGGGPLAGDADLLRAGVEEVAIEGDDDLGGLEAPAGFEPAAEGAVGALVDGFAADGSVGVPAHAGVGAEHGGDGGLEGGRGDGSGEEADLFAGAAAELGEAAGHVLVEAVPALGLVEAADGLGAGGAVEVEDRRLHEDVGAAAGPGVFGVAFNLEGAAIAGGGEDAVGEAVEEDDRGVVFGDAGLGALGGVDVRDFAVARVGHLVAAGEAGEGEGGGHEAHELAAVRPGGEGGGGGELALHEVAEGGGVGQVVEAAPLLAGGAAGWVAHRWHVEQSSRRSGLAMLYCLTSCGPSVSWLAGGVHSMFQTWSGVRTKFCGLRWQLRQNVISRVWAR